MSVGPLAGGEAVVLALDPDPAVAFLHLPRPRGFNGVSVLLCPPFGWEEVCSYRARRNWADALADAGFAAARLELPATGDSGGSPRDPDRLEAWTHAVDRAAEWLRERTGAERVAVIGIGLGGLLACRAAARGAAIDDLVLWSVRARGRALLREMRAYAQVIADRYPEESRPDLLAPGELDLAGFLMSADTVRALEGVDLGAGPGVPRGEATRVLLLERDGLPVDRALREHFEQAGADVTVRPTGDYASMMLEPQDALTPHQTIATSVAWLDPGLGDRQGAGATARLHPLERPAMELVCDGSPIRETPLRLDTESGELFGVLTEPIDGPRGLVCAVWLNGGAVRHIGPSRMWVEIARRWAARGVQTVRVDLPEIGESGGAGDVLTNQDLYSAPRVEQARAVLDQLAAHGIGDRFVLGGLCSGAYWTLRVALADERILAPLMINLYAFTWSDALAAERETSSALRGLRSALWRRVIRLELDRELMRRAAHRLRPARVRAGMRRPAERAQADEARQAFERFGACGAEALFLLSHGEALPGQLARLGLLKNADRWPTVRVETLPTRDHVFRAVWLQRLVHESVDRALDRTLAALGSADRDGVPDSLVR